MPTKLNARPPYSRRTPTPTIHHYSYCAAMILAVLLGPDRSILIRYLDIHWTSCSYIRIDSRTMPTTLEARPSCSRRKLTLTIHNWLCFASARQEQDIIINYESRHSSKTICHSSQMTENRPDRPLLLPCYCCIIHIHINDDLVYDIKWKNTICVCWLQLLLKWSRSSWKV